MKIFVETERLLLREIIPEDINGMFELDSNPAVQTYLGNKPISTKKQAQDIINHIRKQYKENGIGRWAVVEKESGEFIGWSGFKYITKDQPINGHADFYDLGYRFIERFWGKGYATESAIGSLKYGFEELKLDKIYAFADADNLVSQKILTKLGMQETNTFLYDGKLHKAYEIENDRNLIL